MTVSVRPTDRLARVAVALVVLLATACGGSMESTTTSTGAPDDFGPVTQEVMFSSNGFELVGDLELPGGPGPHPAVILVHGSGSQTRLGTPTSGLVRRKFVAAGYAVLAWDKPGSGESTGEFDGERIQTQRAEILVDGLEWLAKRPSIDPVRIGVWGLSQAGWVVPRALTMTDQIAIMIVVSGGAEDSIEQMVFQWTERAACRGASDAELELMETQGLLAIKAQTYDEYRSAMEQLLTVQNLDSYVGVDVELADVDDWAPWPRDGESFFDPATVLQEVTIPVLAIYAEHDVQIDPAQGARAYRDAMEAAGNTDFRVETIPGANHIMRPTAGPCGPESSGIAEEYLELIDDWLEAHPADG